MKRNCTFLLLGLTAVYGCKKNNPEPEFTGRWEWVQSKAFHYTTSGSLDHSDNPNTPATVGSIYMIVTADSMNAYSPNFTLHQGFTRKGNVISVTPKSNGAVVSYDLSIEELTSHQLVLHNNSHYPASAGGKLELLVISEYNR